MQKAECRTEFRHAIAVARRFAGTEGGAHILSLETTATEHVVMDTNAWANEMAKTNPHWTGEKFAVHSGPLGRHIRRSTWIATIRKAS